MLLRVTHIGTRPDPDMHGHNWTPEKRLYHVQTHTGLSGVIALEFVGNQHGVPSLSCRLHLLGTQYSREYPLWACSLPPKSPPHIRDLEGGYQTVASFLATWEHATPEQREDLAEYDNDVKNGRGIYSYGYRLTDRKLRKRGKWALRHCEDRPRTLKAAPVDISSDGTWYRVDPVNLKAALKGTKAAVRIGSVTIKPAILRQLCQETKADLIELREERDALGFRTVDFETRYDKEVHSTVTFTAHKTQCTIRHGAGDAYAGRNGWEARIVFAQAA